MPNATETKFGEPATRIAQTACWTVLVRPQQPTLGSLVLVCREPITAFSDASAQAFAELQGMVRTIEAILREHVAYERINYLMLMMVDPDVHFHVIPRYNGSRDHAGVAYPDAGWPGPPALANAQTPDAAALESLTQALRALWVRHADR